VLGGARDLRRTLPASDRGNSMNTRTAFARWNGASRPSGLEDGNKHTRENPPFVIAGKGGGGKRSHCETSAESPVTSIEVTARVASHFVYDEIVLGIPLDQSHPALDLAMAIERLKNYPASE